MSLLNRSMAEEAQYLAAGRRPLKRRESIHYSVLFLFLVMSLLIFQWASYARIVGRTAELAPTSVVQWQSEAVSISPGAAWNRPSFLILEGGTPVPTSIYEAVTHVFGTATQHTGQAAVVLAAAFDVEHLPAAVYLPPNCGPGVVDNCRPSVYTWPQGADSPPAAAPFTAWLLGTMRVQFSLIADTRSSVKFVETLPSGKEGTTLEVKPLSRTWVTSTLETEWTASINGTVVARAQVVRDGAFAVRSPGACNFWHDFSCKLNLVASEKVREDRKVYESDRIKLIRDQPPHVPKFTTNGFNVVQTPSLLLEALQDYLTINKLNYSREGEGDLVTNLLVDIPMTGPMTASINAIMKPIMEKWSGATLVPTAVYGIRVYRRGSSLDNHVDRNNTHVISAIINVEQKVDTPWPLEIMDHGGVDHKVTIIPGEMILYEGASCRHGRAELLNGDWFANLFVHFTMRSMLPDLDNQVN